MSTTEEKNNKTYHWYRQ